MAMKNLLFTLTTAFKIRSLKRQIAQLKLLSATDSELRSKLRHFDVKHTAYHTVAKLPKARRKNLYYHAIQDELMHSEWRKALLLCIWAESEPLTLTDCRDSLSDNTLHSITNIQNLPFGGSGNTYHLYHQALALLDDNPLLAQRVMALFIQRLFVLCERDDTLSTNKDKPHVQMQYHNTFNHQHFFDQVLLTFARELMHVSSVCGADALFIALMPYQRFIEPERLCVSFLAAANHHLSHRPVKHDRMANVVIKHIFEHGLFAPTQETIENLIYFIGLYDTSRSVNVRQYLPDHDWSRYWLYQDFRYDYGIIAFLSPFNSMAHWPSDMPEKALSIAIDTYCKHNNISPLQALEHAPAHLKAPLLKLIA